MSVQRLVLLSGLFMMLTALLVYIATTPAGAPEAQERPNIGPEEPTSASAAGSPQLRTSLPGASARSNPPSIAEWLTGRLVTVAGLPDPPCTARRLGEWLRIACEGTSATGGTPSDLRLLDARAIKTEVGSTGIVHVAWKLGRDSVYTANGARILSLVCPFVEGSEVRARFAWTDGAGTLVVRWPKGLPEPDPIGVFARVAP